jgi:diaminopimelate epimerase
VRLPGGDLRIAWDADDHVLMTGEVELEREMRLDPGIFEESGA